MIMTPHILAGAALGSLMPGSALGKTVAFFIGLGSHYLLDAIPHWERIFGQHFNEGLDKDHDDWPRHILVQGAVDIFIGLLLLRYFSRTVPVSLAWGVFLGGVGGAVPDVVDNMPFWAKWTKRIPLLNATEYLHRLIHISGVKQRQYPKYTGLLTQAGVVIVAGCVLLSR